MQSYWTAQAVFKEVSDWLAQPKEKLVRLIMAMTCVENGIKWEEVDRKPFGKGMTWRFRVCVKMTRMWYGMSIGIGRPRLTGNDK